MTQVLQIAKQQFMEPAGLTEGDLDRVLGGLMGPGIDGGDLYFQLTRHESWSLEDGIVKDGSYNIEQGVGVRALRGDKTGFAYSDDIRMPTLLEASSAARAIARAASSGTAAMRRDQAGHSLYAPLDPLATLDEQAKIDLLHRVDAEARRQDPRVSQVMVSLNGVHEVIMVANTDGTLAADVRPLVRLNVNVIVEGKDGRREQASSGGGGRSGYEFFLDEERALRYAKGLCGYSRAGTVKSLHCNDKTHPLFGYQVRLGYPAVREYHLTRCGGADTKFLFFLSEIHRLSIYHVQTGYDCSLFIRNYLVECCTMYC